MRFKEGFIDALYTQLSRSSNPLKQQSCTFYDMLATRAGSEEFIKLITSVYTCLKRAGDYGLTSPNILQKNTNSSSQRQSQNSNVILNNDSNAIELKLDDFNLVIHEIFDEVVEFQVMDIFMLFQVQERVYFKDLYLIVCMSASQIQNQSLEFFYQFGEMIFLALKQYNNRILGLTLKVFSKIYGIESRRVNNVFKTLNMKSQVDYNYEDFEVFCFALCNQDHSQGQGQSHSRFNKSTLTQQKNQQQGLDDSGYSRLIPPKHQQH